MRYFVTGPQGEQGPFAEEVLREWLQNGTMPRDAQVRAEGEATSRPASAVFGGGGGFGAGQTPFGASPGSNIYAPPTDTGGGGDGWVPMNQGSFGQGFLLGFFCGCVGLIIAYASSSMGSETKRGVRVGFAVQACLGILIRILALAAR